MESAFRCGARDFLALPWQQLSSVARALYRAVGAVWNWDVGRQSQVRDPDQLPGAGQNQRGNKAKQVARQDKYKDRRNNISRQWGSWG